MNIMVRVTFSSSYGLSAEELDHLLNYDIKFRLGPEEDGNGDTEDDD